MALPNLMFALSHGSSVDVMIQIQTRKIIITKIPSLPSQSSCPVLKGERTTAPSPGTTLAFWALTIPYGTLHTIAKCGERKGLC